MASVQPRLTLEQVYQTASTWRAYHPPGTKVPKKLILKLTALADQACAEEGIDPADLTHRAVYAFAEPNISEEIQLMRHAAYMQMREDKMDCVLRARDAIISRRSDREKLAKAVEEQVRATLGDEAVDSPRCGGDDGTLMTWTGKTFAGLDGRRMETAPAPVEPVSFADADGFAALYSQAPSPVKAARGGGVPAPRAPSTVGPTSPAARAGAGAKKRSGNEVLVRAKAIEARRREHVDRALKRREEALAARLEQADIVREVSLRSKAEIRDQRIKLASEAAKNLEERRQRRARRRLIKKFLKSAALQMTTLEDVEKETELKALKERKRQDFVARAERKHEYRISRIQEAISRKEDRVRTKQKEREAALRRQKLKIQREQITREKILEADRRSAMLNRRPKAAEMEMVSVLQTTRMPRSPPKPKTAEDPSMGRLYVSPAAFPAFCGWMLLQHFGVKHEVVNVQVLDDTTREAFAGHFSPLRPSMQLTGGDLLLGVADILKHVVDYAPISDGDRASLWPAVRADSDIIEDVLRLVEVMNARALQYVLPLLTPLMKPFEAKLAAADLNTWEEAAREESKGPEEYPRLPLERLVEVALTKLDTREGAFLLGEDVSIADFALIPSFHILLLSGYPLPEAVLDYLASFASCVPALVELEEPLCVLFSRLSTADENPPYSPHKPSKSYATGSRRAPAAAAVH